MLTLPSGSLGIFPWFFRCLWLFCREDAHLPLVPHFPSFKVYGCVPYSALCNGCLDSVACFAAFLNVRFRGRASPRSICFPHISTPRAWAICSRMNTIDTRATCHQILSLACPPAHSSPSDPAPQDSSWGPTPAKGDRPA